MSLSKLISPKLQQTQTAIAFWKRITLHGRIFERKVV